MGNTKNKIKKGLDSVKAASGKTIDKGSEIAKKGVEGSGILDRTDLSIDEDDRKAYEGTKDTFIKGIDDAYQREVASKAESINRDIDGVKQETDRQIEKLDKNNSLLDELSRVNETGRVSAEKGKKVFNSSIEQYETMEKQGKQIQDDMNSALEKLRKEYKDSFKRLK